MILKKRDVKSGSLRDMKKLCVEVSEALMLNNEMYSTLE